MSSDPRYKSARWRYGLRANILKIVDGKPTARCAVLGCIATASVADHIKSPRNGGAFWDSANLRPLCTDHDHQIKEMPSGERRRAGKPIVRGCDASGRPLDPSHLWAAVKR